MTLPRFLTWFLITAGCAPLVIVGCVSCGSATPRSSDPAMVIVLGEPVRTTSVDHWIRILSAERNRGVPIVYDPPGFSNCILTKHRQGGVPQTGEVSLSAACQREYDELRTFAVEFLVHGAWIRREARRNGVVLTRSDLREARIADRSQYPFPAAFRRARQGMSSEDYRKRIASKALLEKVRALAFPLGALSERRLHNFYRARRADFVEPRTRLLRAAFIDRRQSAWVARRALENGRSWEAIVAQYSDDPMAKKLSGRMQIDTNNRIRALRRVVFGATRGKLVGPVRIRDSWLVFSVKGEKKRRQHTFDELRRDMLPSLVRQQWEMRTLDKLAIQLERRYRPRTICVNGSQFHVCGRQQGADRQ
jgi:hypothetical protein